MFDALIQGYYNILQSIHVLQTNLLTLPIGWIEHVKRNGKLYRYPRYRKNGVKKTLHVDDIDEHQKLLDKRKFLEVQLSQYMIECHEYEKTLRRLKINPEDIQLEFSQFLKLREAEQSTYTQKVLEAQLKRYSENYRFPTIQGDLVASKSEMAIANALAREQLPYEYEKALTFPEGIFHPDFTIYYHGKTYLWEHLGLLDNPTYRKSWEQKRSVYEIHNIFEGVNLIVTRETRNYPLTQSVIDDVIKNHFKQQHNSLLPSHPVVS